MPFTATRGGRLDVAALLDRLKRLDYEEVRGEPTRPGTFKRDGKDWTLYLRAAVTPDGEHEALPVRLDVFFRRLREITDLRTGEQLERFSLEPEPLITFYADVMEERRFTPLAEVPPELRQAVEVVEDRRFRSHHGIDPIGTARALTVNVRSGGFVQGGSTITQQLAKNLYGTGERTLTRKAVEALAAIALELHYDKDTILEAYLNEVYLGQRGPVAISGVGDAARFYFGCHVGDLDLAQSALLAGMIRSPGRYHPRLHPKEARERRDLVLELMHEHGQIDEAHMRAATAARLATVETAATLDRFPWLEDYLAGAMEAMGLEAVPSRSGYSIFTTFDPEVQRAAQEALAAGLARIDRHLGPAKAGAEPLEGAIVVLRPADGALLALVGGRDYGRSQFNRAVQARRSPGSTFKPFVFAAGLERALRQTDFEFTVATVFEDAPFEIKAGGKMWSPANFDRLYRGPVTVRDALEQSINVPTVRAALTVGLGEVVEVAHRYGIDSELEAVPSLALGAEEVTPLELATAYAPLANGGWRVHAHGLTALVDRDGVPRDPAIPPPEAVMEPALAYLVTNVLEGAVERGTARAAHDLGLTGHAAGKTGTSNDLRDAWFVGYTPDVLALVWVGYDDNRLVGMTGGAAALPIWVDLIARIGEADADPFPRPDGIVEISIDPTTGQRATRRCPERRDELFLRGAEPEERCAVHGGAREHRRPFWRRFGRKR
jgi:penicillin-binding protein 1B